MNEKEREILANELKKNTEILENLFEQYNLRVISIAFSGRSNDTQLDLWVEVSAIKGTKIKLPKDDAADVISIKVNYYENGNLLCSDYVDIDAENFGGYDTVHLCTYYTNLLNRATSARIFAVLDY